MAFSEYAMMNHYHPWTPLQTYGEPRQHSLTVMSNAPSWSSYSGSPSVQSIQRYLKEPVDRQLFQTIYDGDGSIMHPFPDVPVSALKYTESEGSLSSLPPRGLSPSNGGMSSSWYSSTQGEDEPTPFTSPELSAAASTPETPYHDYSTSGYVGNLPYGSVKGADQNTCVALHDVQEYPDAQPDKLAFEDEQALYGSCAQEGYQPMHRQQDVIDEYPRRGSHQLQGCSEIVGDDTSVIAPVIRRRRSSTVHSLTPHHLSAKIQKRPTNAKRASPYHSRSHADNVDSATIKRIFPCPFATYGCSSTFSSKNEWKRHTATQHMRLGFWRCDQCPHGDKKPNDFNRKDLFIQHVRRMHPFLEPSSSKKSRSTRYNPSKNDIDERMLAELSERSYLPLRSAPKRSSCLICDITFDGVDSWNARMEHVGAHMEATKKEGEKAVEPAEWRIDHDMDAWLAEEGIIVRRGNRWVLT